MSNAIPVHIVFVRDRSGSMAGLRNDVIGGFNQFLADQQAQEGKCRFTDIQFDTESPFEVLADAVPIADVKPLTQGTFVPRGGTPLLDAEGRAIAKMRERVAARKAQGKKAEAILFVTFTDGMENSSREWTHEKLTKAKKECEEEGWTFMYLGVGHDAYGQSAMIGSLITNTSSVAATPDAVAASYSSLSQVSSGIRSFAAQGDSASLLAASKDAYTSTGAKKADADDLAERSTS